jgi:hypothetical protein
MWNIPSKERLAKIPKLYETENTSLKDKLIYLHFFIGGCDWYIAEYDGEDLFWGFAILNSDFQNSEWGYISFRELKGIKMDAWLEIDCEIEEVWQVCKASEIEKIKKAQGWDENKNEDKGNTKVKEKQLVEKVKAGHFQHFQDLFAEVTSPYSDFFGIDPYPIWEATSHH